MNILLAIAFIIVSAIVYFAARQWATSKKYIVPESFGYAAVGIVVVILALVMGLMRRC